MKKNLMSKLKLWHLLAIIFFYISGASYEHIQKKYDIYPCWLETNTEGTFAESLGKWTAVHLYYTNTNDWISSRGMFFQTIVVGLVLLTGILWVAFIKSWQWGFHRTCGSIAIHGILFGAYVVIAPWIYSISESLYNFIIGLI